MTTPVALFAAVFLAMSIPGHGRTVHVDQSHPSAADTHPGTLEQPLLTIQRAADLVQPGDRIRIHGGIYRETVRPPRGGEPGRPIVYEGDPEGKTIIRGSVVWNAQWTASDTHAGYTAPIDFLQEDEGNPYELALNVAPPYYCELQVRPVPDENTPLVATTGQLFVNSQPYGQVAALTNLVPRTWMVDRDGKHIHIRMPAGESPDDAQIEVTTKKHLFMPQHRGFGYIHLRHLVFEHSTPPGPFPQRGMVSTRTGHHWIIEHCVFAHSMTIGLDCGNEGYGKTFIGVYDSDEYEKENLDDGGYNKGSHIVRYNRIAHNAVCGIAVYQTTNSIFYGNTFEDNAYMMEILPSGRKRIDDYRTERTSWNEYAAFKSHGFRDSVIVGNLFTKNYRSLFLDTGFNGAIVSANVFAFNHANSLILERPWTDEVQTVVINNVFIANSENDMRTMDLSRATLANNLFLKSNKLTPYDLAYYDINRSAPLCFIFNYQPGVRQMRRGYRISIIGNRILNNVILGNTASTVVLPHSDIADTFGAFYRDNLFDCNVIESPVFGFHTYEFPGEGKRKITGTEEVGLDVWRNRMGNAQNTVVYDPATMGTIRALHGYILEMDLKEGFFGLKTCPVPQRRTDFFGKPVPKDGALPGPFEGLHTGRQTLKIWPVPIDDTEVERLIQEGRIQDLLGAPSQRSLETGNTTT
jgi:hypothetical protein